MMVAASPSEPGGLQAYDLVPGHGPPIALHVGAGECLGLTGASGSGKSRLLRALADLDPVPGVLRLDGQPRESMSGPTWRRRVMLVPSESYWWADTVGQHLPEAPSPRELTSLGLHGALLDRCPSDVSSGERQRLALLRAVLRRPRILLLDEPTANLDASNAARAEAWLRARRHEGIGLIWVSHDAEQIARVADRALHLGATGLVRQPQR